MAAPEFRGNRDKGSVFAATFPRGRAEALPYYEGVVFEFDNRGSYERNARTPHNAYFSALTRASKYEDALKVAQSPRNVGCETEGGEEATLGGA